MRGIAWGAVVALVLTLLPVAPAAASHEMYQGVRHSEVYRASLPLTKKNTASITVERYFGKGYTSTTPVGAGSFYGCVSIYDNTTTSYSYSYYYSYSSRCNDLDVMTYEFDVEMNRLKIHFDLPDQYGQLPPVSVYLVARGSGPVRNRTPAAGTSYYPSYYSTSGLSPWVSLYSSRRATARGTIIVPGLGTRKIKRHSARRGLFERRTFAASSLP